MRSFFALSLWINQVRLFRRKAGFTLIEVLAMATLFVMVSGILYKLFSGTWSNFYKSQAKLTNLRAASLLLEHVKHDIRMSAIPSADPNSKVEVSPTGEDLKFQVTDGINVKTIRYTFDAPTGQVIRTENETDARTISMVKVSEFSVTIEGEGTPNKHLKAVIKVDADKDDKNRTQASKGNQVELSAILFPKFFQDFADPAEKYWNNARSVQ